MNTYHVVVTKITDRRNTMRYGGIVKADTLPPCEFTSTAKADTYVDYFESKEEADLFIRTNRQFL